MGAFDSCGYIVTLQRGCQMNICNRCDCIMFIATRMLLVIVSFMLVIVLK